MHVERTRVVLTGAASGIGLAILKELLKLDCRIVAADKNAEQLEKVTLSAFDQVIPFTGDLSGSDQIDQLFDFATSTLGSIDIFIANAGFAYYEQLGEPDWNHIDKIFRINSLSPIYSLMKMQRLNPGNPWKTVMISSAIGEWAVPGYAIYGATKAAISRFADGYRFDHSGNNLMVVYPIATRTNFFETAGKDIPEAFPIQSAEKVARKIIRGIRHDRRHVYPSKLFLFILTVNRFLPFIKPAYQSVEHGKFRKWLKSNPS
jgi:short-subunit dehydrogenase